MTVSSDLTLLLQGDSPKKEISLTRIPTWHAGENIEIIPLEGAHFLRSLCQPGDNLLSHTTYSIASYME